MTTPRSESEAVAARLAQAAERLKAQQAPDAAPASDALSAEDALLLLKTLCAELRDADLEVRRARSQIAQLAADAAARRAPPEAA
jgi:hypothetical protein